MPNWTRKDLENQYKRAVRQGWLAHFKEAASLFGFNVADLLAIASRETDMGGRELKPGVFEWLNRLGDNGRGCGLMQVDIGTDAAFLKSGKWKDARAGILRGTEVLDGKRHWFRRNAGQKDLVVRFSSGGRRTFNGRAFTDAQLRRLTVAAYNCGQAPAYYHFSTSGDPDRGTTGADYSADTLARADVFAQLLAQSPATPAPARRDAEPVAADEEREEPTYEPSEVEPDAASKSPAKPGEADEPSVFDLAKEFPATNETKKAVARRAWSSGKGKFGRLLVKAGIAWQAGDWVEISGYLIVVAAILIAAFIYRKEIKRGLLSAFRHFQK